MDAGQIVNCGYPFKNPTEKSECLSYISFPSISPHMAPRVGPEPREAAISWSWNIGPCHWFYSSCGNITHLKSWPEITQCVTITVTKGIHHLLRNKWLVSDCLRCFDASIPFTRSKHFWSPLQRFQIQTCQLSTWQYSFPDKFFHFLLDDLKIEFGRSVYTDKSKSHLCEYASLFPRILCISLSDTIRSFDACRVPFRRV